MTRKIVLQTDALTIGYRKPAHIVAEGLSLSLRRGEMVCLIGPNGAGKTTLMRTIAGMHKPLAGEVWLAGDDVFTLPANELARRLSIVLTERVNVGRLTGYALVALGRHPYTDWSGVLSAADEAAVRWAVQAVGAVTIAPRNVNELSDGERQKLMIARALAQEPTVMLLDEPTAYLDLPRRVDVMQLLRDVARQTDRAVLLSTHDLDLALRTADCIWLMSSGGELVTGAPEDLVLSGAFERAFASEGVQFDPRTGSFRAQREVAGQVRLVGDDGIRRSWTERALTRAGFAVQPDATITVTVLPDAWRLDVGTSTHDVNTVAALVDLLRGL